MGFEVQCGAMNRSTFAATVGGILINFRPVGVPHSNSQCSDAADLNKQLGVQQSVAGNDVKGKRRHDEMPEFSLPLSTQQAQTTVCSTNSAAYHANCADKDKHFETQIEVRSVFRQSTHSQMARYHPNKYTNIWGRIGFPPELGETLVQVYNKLQYDRQLVQESGQILLTSGRAGFALVFFLLISLGMGNLTIEVGVGNICGHMIPQCCGIA
jgi:hypothetical protein